VIALDTIFSPDQVENLKVWKNSLQTEVALGWKAEEDKAEEQIPCNFEDKSAHFMRKQSKDFISQKILYMKKRKIQSSFKR